MKISLVVPMKDEAESLPRLLSSLSGQTRVPDEAIFVDAGSRDATKRIIQEYPESRFPFNVVSAGPVYPGTARNIGAQKATYEAVAFTDGGIELDPEWLRELSAVMEKDPSADIVYGTYTPKTDTFFKRCLAIAFVAPQRPIGGTMARTDFIASSLMKKRVWQEAGGFPDFRAAEDRIFMENVRKKGFAVRNAPKAEAVWDIPNNLQETWVRFFRHSFHDLIAGRAADWHMPVLRMYAAAVICVILGYFLIPWFFSIPIAGCILRVIRKMYAYRHEPFMTLRHIPISFAVTGLLIYFIDMAMFAGWIAYLLGKGRP